MLGIVNLLRLPGVPPNKPNKVTIPSPAGRFRRANLHLPRSTASRSSTYIELLSTFVRHTSENGRGAVTFR
jgi:hypothetical protein